MEVGFCIIEHKHNEEHHPDLDTYDKNVVECQERGIRKNMNQIFYEFVRGRKKGKVHGLETGADLYFERSSRQQDLSSTTCTPSIISQLSARLEDSECARAEWKRERASFECAQLEMERERMQMQMEREEHEFLGEMKRTMESYNQMFSQCGGSFPFSLPRDPPPDSLGSGAPCAT